MEWLRQPTDKVCGQTCVAMITGKTVDEVCTFIGEAKTNPRELREALGRFGYSMELRASSKLPKYPDELALLFGQTISEHRLFAHWCAWDGNELLDPTWGLEVKKSEGWSGRFYIVRPAGKE